ncbi:hypothetical protein C2S53_009281 [Perilla frutescens var. hirtella]|uniref:Uncharacterized protein n=1 Tax=Perilla frutescens var. hirtella TaxID=608512 RepID=A0AAD4P9C3_PERFH|nr:hypothetical protein C2S53_009281 [Perilla frutescens var. hirtella]
MPTRAVVNGGVEAVDGVVRGDAVGKRVVFKDVGKEREIGSLKNSCSQSISFSDESSSLGKNSDLSDNSMEKSGDGEEVESSFKDPFDGAMEALEEVLPIRRGISRFYNGKAKSFTTLADASSSSSAKDLAKSDNGFMRRRRNLLAYSLTWDNNRSSCLKSNGGGISKRVTGSSRATLALAVALNNSDIDRQTGECTSAGSVLVKDFSGWRSFSLADLQQCVSVGKCRDSDQFVTKPC